jgi:carboxyl-terminal processing protease
VSSYEDPRWYEQPASNDVPVTGQPPLAQPEQAQSPEAQSAHPLNAGNGKHDEAFPQQFYSYPAVAAPRDRRGRGSGGRKFGQFVLLAALLLIVFLGGWFGNQYYANSFNPGNQSQSYENLFQQAWSIVDQHYVDRKAVNYKQMSYQAIQAMLKVLHDTGHTRFLTPQDVQNENQQLSGTFTGVGLYLSQDSQTKQLIIDSTIPGSPAEKAGFKHGDIITAINGASTAGKDIPAVSALIQGKAGTSVTITVKRPSTGQTLSISVVRAQITVQNVVMHYIAREHIADIQVVQFASGVSDQLKSALQQAKKLGAHKIILDLRENPGGYLQEAIDTASEFIKAGNVLLEQDSSGHRTPYAVTGSTIDTTDPIVVLINADTASAAEIVSGALQDNKRAILIGQTTFGTGTVLQEYTLADGSAILLGTQEWLTPNGNFIRGNGIHPNIEVKLPAKHIIETASDENSAHMSEQQVLASGDTQLVAAIRYLEAH